MDSPHVLQWLSALLVLLSQRWAALGLCWTRWVLMMTFRGQTWVMGRFAMA